MLNLEELQKEFINAHCAWTLFCNTESKIGTLIKSKLPKNIKESIIWFGFDLEFADSLVFEMGVQSEDVDKVHASLATIYPSITWSIKKMPNCTVISVTLDDECIASLPLYLYE